MAILVKVTPKRVLFDAFLTSLAAVGVVLAPSQATAQEVNVVAEQICTDKQVLFEKARRMNSEVEQMYERGRYEEATPLAEQAATLIERALGPNRRDVAIAFGKLAALYREQRKYKAAAARMKRALGISIMAPDSKNGDVALLLFGLADIYLRQEMYREAEPLLEMALRISEREMIAPAVKANLDALFGVYAALGKSDKAEKALTNLLHIVEADLGGDHPRLLELLNRRAILHAGMGRFGDAEKDLNRALEIAESKAVRVSEAITTLQALAGLYVQRKQLDEAERLCRKALDIAKEKLSDGSQVEADILGVFAWIHLMRDEYDEAEAVLKRVLSIRQSGMGSSHTSVAEPLGNLGVIYLLQGKYREAEESLTRALSIAESVLPPNHPNVAMRLCHLAMLFAATNDIDRALTHAERAERASDEHLSTMIRRGDELQKHCFLANGSSQLDFGVTLAVRASGHARAQRLALQHILRRKGRALDAMRSTLATIRDNLDNEGQELLEQYLSVRSRYADQSLSGPQGIPHEQNRKNLTQLDQQKRDIEYRLSEKSIRFAELNQSISLDDVRNALPRNSVLVEWIQYEPVDVSAHKKREERKVPARYAACLLPHGTAEPACLDLGDAETIDASALAFHRALALGLEVQALARKLDELIMAPVREKLGNVRKIYLSPDGMLHFIPFAALMYKDNTGRSHYLLEHFELIYVTSGRDLVRKPRSSFEAGPVTVLGAPHYDVPGQASTHRFSPLFGVLQEVEDIFGLFVGAWLLADIDATEDAVKNVRAPLILHLATHAYFGPSDCEGRPQQMTDPLLATGLALAGANACHDGAANNGILTGEEIAGLDLYGTQLVVLSACDTGIGSLAINEDDRVVGMHEGVHGLRRALVLAGAETQVVSLWKVNDRATRVLMGAYYRALLQGGGRAEALRHVQLSLLRSEEWAHPYFWASFVVVGSDAPLRLPVGSVRPGALRGPRGCTCQLGPAHPAQGWAVLVLASAVLVVVRRRRGAVGQSPVRRAGPGVRRER